MELQRVLQDFRIIDNQLSLQLWFGSYTNHSPSLVSKLSLFVSLPVCRQTSLLTGAWGRRWRKSKIKIKRRRESLFLYKPFNTLCRAVLFRFKQCCGSMTFWCGSGSADLCLWQMDPDADPDPAIFIIDLQDANKKLIFLKHFFCILLLEGTFTSFFKDKKSQNSRNQNFAYYFCLMI